MLHHNLTFESERLCPLLRIKMDSIEPATQLKRAGRFRDALATLESTRIAQDMRLDGQLLKLELFERVGQHDNGSQLAALLKKSRGLSALAHLCQANSLYF